jgi:hypothetical protein
MKRLTLLLLGLALGVSSAATAQGLTMQMSNGWSFSFSGNVNVFWVFTHTDSSAALGPGFSNSSVRTGLLPTFATFEAKGKEAGLNLGIHFGFAPQIQNAGVHDNFGNGTQAGAQIDMRQVYLTVGFKDGSQILAGRELGLFGRQNIIQDMTLFGVGAVGIAASGSGAGAQGGGTTLGRIGYGYIYPNFVPQVTYSTKPGEAQLSVGLFQPSIFGQGAGTNAASAAYVFTTIPRVEAEFTYNQKSGKNAYMFWVGGLWQSTKDAPTGGNTISSVGGTAGVKVGMSDLSLLVSGYIGSGLGTVLMFSGQEVAPSGTDARKSDGGYAQVMYKVGPKTNVGVSWGFSRLKNAGAGETAASGGNNSVRTQWTLATAGIYHQWTKSLKLVFEGSREQEGVGTGRPAQIDISGGFMLFF